MMMKRPKSSHVFGILRVEKGDRSAGVAIFSNLSVMTPATLDFCKVVVLRARLCVGNSGLDN